MYKIIKQFAFAWLACYVILTVLCWVENAVVLKDLYNALDKSWHNASEDRAWLFSVIVIVTSFFFTMIYTQWMRTGSALEGALYGGLVGFWFTFALGVSVYVTSPIPMKLVFYWMVTGVFIYALAGMAVARVYNWKKE
jgi:uncharacterized membrane protein YidH (DUF202 family)